MPQKPFIHLHTHTHYSLLDGLSKIKDVVKRAKENGSGAVAITDHGNLYGAIEFYKECLAAGVKPIIGVEAYIANRTRFDKESGIDNKRYHLILLAKNLTGYKNLIKLVTLSHTEGYYYKPRMDKELLREHSEGLISLSGCFGSELSRALRNKDKERALSVIAEHQDIFGKENYFLEIQKHPGIEGHDAVERDLISLSKELNIPLVATQDSHYSNVDDKKAHETLLAVQSGGEPGESKFTFGVDDFSFIDTKTAYEYFKDVPEAVENTNMVADMCDLEIPLGNWVFPDLKLPAGTNYDDELKRQAYEGLAKRGLPQSKEVMDRLEYELKVIRDKKYSPYFLVVGDLLQFAQENGILTNVRGSVAGSLTTYLLGITLINPLEYKLPFERFLNPERPSAPDIDMDFADNRRDEVIEYARKKYGDDHVAQIGTFGTMMARGSVRDVARALGYPYETGDKISKLIPMGSQGFPMTIEHALEITSELKELYKKDADTRVIIDLARKLEGCVRHISVHAAGVVISPSSLSDWVPVQYDPKGGKLITQYDMYAVEDVGLLKFDFLGIRNLAILADAVRLVKKYHEIDIDLEKIPLDDKKTFAMIGRGETVGLFQLNGSGMTKYLVELKPTNIHDINLMVALYRPGPMENINEYIARKHGKKPASYLHPKMKNFLEETFGVLVYQDDLLMTAVEVAGYSWGEVDKFRKAVGKKIPEEMAKQHVKFVEGCVSSGGLTKEKAEDIWKLFEPFQGYGFNKSHAASYGLVAYQTAFLKANYPSEYMAAVLSAEAGDVEKISEIISECKRMKIPVLPPDVNESMGDFAVIRVSNEKDSIRFGLHSVKNLGNEIADAIISEREKNGKYKTLADFLERITHKNLNKKSLESLVKCGAMDELGERGAMLTNTDELLEYNRERARGSMNGQSSLFGLLSVDTSLPSLKLKPGSAATATDKLSWEKELLGLYVSGHPLDRIREKLEKREWNIKKIKEDLREGMAAVPAGIIEDSRIVQTKKGEQMAFVKISDFSGTIEVVVFPRVYEQFKASLSPDSCVAIRGSFSKRNGDSSIIAEDVKVL